MRPGEDGPSDSPHLRHGAEPDADGPFSELVQADPPSDVSRIWCIGIFVAFLGSFLGWYAGRVLERYYHWSARVEVVAPRGAAPADGVGFTLFLETREDADGRNTALAMGIFGTALGLVSGLGGGWTRRSVRRMVLAGVTGLVLGALAGAISSWYLVPVFYWLMAQGPNPLIPVMTHSGVYSAIGGAAGLAFGVGHHGIKGSVPGLVAGTLGALLGSLFYEVFHTLAFPMEWDHSPLPGKGLSRLLAHCCVAGLSIPCVALALTKVSGAESPSRPGAA